MVGKKRIICGFLICLFALYLSTIAAADKADSTTNQNNENHTTVNPLKDSTGNIVIENTNYKMLFDEKTLGVIIEDKKTGFQYESIKFDEKSNNTWQGFMNSGVNLEFYSASSMQSERVDVAKGAPQIDFTYYNDGIDADLYYQSYDFHMSLELRLKSDGMTASVKKNSIVEGEKYKLGAIYLYPMFGATLLGEKNGYMFVPEGAGALIDLQDNHGKYKTPYIKKIFGDNIGLESVNYDSDYWLIRKPQEITAPVFGMIYTNRQQGFLGIAENGEYNADILAYPNGVMTDYNWITTKFNFREIYTMQTSTNTGVPTYEKNADMRDIGVRFILVSGEKADYVGLAKEYQSYLIDGGVLEKKEDQFKVKLDFFGADSKDWFIFDVVVPMTTVNQMDQILTDLIDDDMKDILPVYTGWQSKGITINNGSGNFNIERKLGSQKKLFSLIEKLNKKNINLILEQELLCAYPSRFYNTSKNIVKGINQIIVNRPLEPYLASNYYLTPSKSLDFATKFMKKYKNTSVQNVSLSSISNMLFSYYSGGKNHTRGNTVEIDQKVMEEFGAMNLSLSNPNEYLWKYTDRYFNMPLSTSNYNYLSKEVPFLPIVLKGYIPYWADENNFEANEDKFFLKMIEYGAYPCFLITEESPNKLRNSNYSFIYTSQYSVLKDTIEDYYHRLGDALRLVEGASIESHKYITNKVVEVGYDNGVKFIINYSDEDYKFGDVDVPVMSFSVK